MPEVSLGEEIVEIELDPEQQCLPPAATMARGRNLTLSYRIRKSVETQAPSSRKTRTFGT